MKLSILALALFGITTMASGQKNDQPSLTVNRVDSSSVYQVNYSDKKPGKVTLVIKDDRGNILVKRAIQNENGFSMPADFSSVAEGTYHLETDNGLRKQTAEVLYNNNTPPTYSRVVDLGEGRYLLSTSHAESETITVKIFDGFNKVIYDEDIKIKGGMSMIFNLKGIVGRPSFEVTEFAGHSLMVPGSPVVAVMKLQ